MHIEPLPAVSVAQHHVSVQEPGQSRQLLDAGQGKFVIFVNAKEPLGIIVGYGKHLPGRRLDRLGDYEISDRAYLTLAKPAN